MMRGHAADTSDRKVLRESWAEPPFPPPPEPPLPPARATSAPTPMSAIATHIIGRGIHLGGSLGGRAGGRRL
jgi:hypothetical protein